MLDLPIDFMPQADILLISAPLRHPFVPDFTLRAAAAALEAKMNTVVRFDAAADFSNFWVRDVSLRQKMLEKIVQRTVNRDYSDAPDDVRAAAEQVAANPAFWRDRIQTARQETAIDHSAAPDDPALAANHLQAMDVLLNLISAACYPLELFRQGISHPGLKTPQDVAAFCRQDDGNPFREYALMSDPAADLPALAVCLVSRPDQVVPAACLISVWRKRWPRTAWAAWGPDIWVDAVHQAAGIVPDDPTPGQEAMRQALEAREDCKRGPLSIQEVFPTNADAPAAQGVGSLRLQDAVLAETMAVAQTQGLRTIVWHDPQGDRGTITAGLYQVSRKGIWNHLVLPQKDDPPLVAELAAFAAANPGIVHSWCRRAEPVSAFSSPRDNFPQGSVPYGQTKPLPGEPLWQVLRDPVLLTHFVRGLGLKAVTQLRYRQKSGSLMALGRSLVYTYQKPWELPDGYLDEICRMVEAGGSVAVRWVRYNLERAFLIAYVMEHGVIVGNSSLKHPRQEYIEAVSAQSGIDLRHYLERGYTSVRPEYRGFGIGAALLEGLTQRAGTFKIFSVIGEDNIATQKMAVRNRTRKVATFYSERAEKQVGVWIPEWMLPADADLPPQPRFS